MIPRSPLAVPGNDLGDDVVVAPAKLAQYDGIRLFTARARPVLTSAPRTAPERQQTLRATIDWTHDLRSAAERQVRARTAVFAGSFDAIDGLLDKSVLSRDGDLVVRQGVRRGPRDGARTVAKGQSNRDIAAELVISPRTADAHVQHILIKLGFRDRARIAAWVARRH
ncbi:LuxR C-terminal-related transcriptional regulator [Amycolatopsis sp. NPDC059021]|uniref:helix-turn-helix transcriptional regulator n=1 Tax=Amycolatopsis sp. NPDC059021 TaxID=3346704 RepID=UPI003671FE2F